MLLTIEEKGKSIKSKYFRHNYTIYNTNIGIVFDTTKKQFKNDLTTDRLTEAPIIYGVAFRYIIRSGV